MNWEELYKEAFAEARARGEAPPESVAYLTIIDHKPGQAEEKLFAGWMFASTPSLSALDHGVSDLRVLSCTMAQGSSPPSPR